MEKRKNNFFDWLTNQISPDGNVQIVYNPNDNALLTSKLQDDNGNVNLFKMIVDKNAPDLEQRIITNDNRNYN